MERKEIVREIMEKRELHQVNHKKFNYFEDKDKKKQITDPRTLLNRFKNCEEVIIEAK